MHDVGGNDSTQIDCLQTALPLWAWAIAALCVAPMILFRPIYNPIKRLLRQG